MAIDEEGVRKAVRLFLTSIGENPDREGLLETPDRIARACEEIFSGLGRSPQEVLSKRFPVETDEMVLVRDIELFSVCEHHLLPFHGVAHVGYIPSNGQVVGLSKLARLVELYARRPQVQERITQQVADALMEYADAKGVIVVTECEHMCMAMRGVNKPASRTITSAVRGVMRTPATRAATIEKLVQKGFLERKGTKKTKVLLPTDKGKALITVMPEEIQSPEMTADWETKLLRIERSEMEPGEFMTEINTMITELVKNTEMKKGANALMKSKIIGVCPNCGKPVVEREKGWFCENRECRFVLWKDNAFFKRLGKRLDAHVADKLLRDGRVRLKDCKSAKGKTYNATVLLSCEADGRSKFSLEFEGGC